MSRAGVAVIPSGRLFRMPTLPSGGALFLTLRSGVRRGRTPVPAAPTPAELDSLPVTHPHAAGIDVGDRTHWTCVAATPDEFPAHTPGLCELVAWLRQCDVTTAALKASGAYGHVLYLT